VKRGTLRMSNLVYYAVGVGICILIIWGVIDLVNNYIVAPKDKRKIKDNPVLVNGAVIKKIENINKVSDAYLFSYSFYVGNNLITNKHSIGLEFKSNSVYNATNYLMERSLPVVYEKGNPKNSRLLITPNDFSFFQIQFPDSLQWIKEDVINGNSDN